MRGWGRLLRPDRARTKWDGVAREVNCLTESVASVYTALWMNQVGPQEGNVELSLNLE